MNIKRLLIPGTFTIPQTTPGSFDLVSDYTFVPQEPPPEPEIIHRVAVYDHSCIMFYKPLDQDTYIYLATYYNDGLFTFTYNSTSIYPAYDSYPLVASDDFFVVTCRIGDYQGEQYGIVTTTDFSTFTKRFEFNGVPVNNTHGRVWSCYVNEKFITSVTWWRADLQCLAFTSSNGITWTPISVPHDFQTIECVFFNNYYYCSGYAGLFRSSDFENWASIPMHDGEYPDAGGLAIFDGALVATTYDRGLMKSLDGIHWELLVPIEGDSGDYELWFDNQCYLVVGEDGDGNEIIVGPSGYVLYYSYDLIHWYVGIDDTSIYEKLLYKNGVFYFAEWNNIWTSKNGKDWTPITTDVGYSFGDQIAAMS